MEKINIAELLKDCPKGMELDCTMWDNVNFDFLFGGTYPIKVQTPDGQISLNKYGCYSNTEHAKCVIFPKGKTTWEGFHRPFVEGDIVSTEYGIYIGIVKSTEDSHHCDVFCSMNDTGGFFIDKNLLFSRFATEEEKQKLFDVIKANGYKWNPETKALEKLIEPKFKVGDRITSDKINLGTIYNIIEVKESLYIVNKNNETDNYHIDFVNQDYWELVLNKFDITTLKPFESRVLVRDANCYEWEADIFGRYSNGYIALGGGKWEQCIPYEGNEHLLGTTNDCNDFYKTWK